MKTEDPLTFLESLEVLLPKNIGIHFFLICDSEPSDSTSPTSPDKGHIPQETRRTGSPTKLLWALEGQQLGWLLTHNPAVGHV